MNKGRSGIAVRLISGKSLRSTDESELHRFESGAVRSTDADHARYDLIPIAAMEAMATTLKQGAEKYGEHNWKLGIPVSDLWNHLLQHAFKWISGDRSENHIGHLLCNAAFLAHFCADEIAAIHTAKDKSKE